MPPAAARSSPVPLANGIIIHTFREAATQLWGEPSLRAIGSHLPEDVRIATIEVPPPVLQWQPERHVMAWHDAVWAGPTSREDAAYVAFLQLAVNLSFGRVRRALLSLAAPRMIVEKAAALWSHDHTHGTLSVDAFDDASKQLTITLRDHPYVTTERSRRAIAEILRHIASLTRVKNVRESHALKAGGGELVVRLTWT